MKVKRFVSDNAEFLLLTVISNIIAFFVWSGYLDTGEVYHRKYDLVFFGKDAVGHLIAASIFAAVCNFYFVKQVLIEISKKQKAINFLYVLFRFTHNK